MPLTPHNGAATTPLAVADQPPPRRPGGPTASDEAQRRRARQASHRQQSGERLAAATAEIAAQTAQSTEAGRLLVRTIREVAAGAEQASAACEQSLSAVGAVVDHIAAQREATGQGRVMAEALKKLVALTGERIGELITNVKAAAQRQRDSVTRISELERQAEEIGSILVTVAHVADETNLLALNAAIEAARAREHGKGFAVVADEVRALAETSERSAREIRELIEAVRTGVASVIAGVQASSASAEAEMARGDQVAVELAGITAELEDVVRFAGEVAGAALQAEAAAAEIRRMTSEIAASAEQQSAAVTESLHAVEGQTAALTDAERATEEISVMAHDLRGGDLGRSPDELAAAAEELATGAEELNQAASQIAAGLQQISAGAQVQAGRSHAAEAAIAQLEGGAKLAEDRAAETERRTESLVSRVTVGKAGIDAMIETIAAAATAARDNVERTAKLEDASRRIDKIVDVIATVALQTNMLAVNGSVESARAGEFGRGFAVVSADIRSLAKDSSENAERIKGLVQDIQNEIATVRSDLSDTSRLSMAEVVRARESSARLLEVERDVAAIRQAAASTRSASEQIAAALVQVRQGMDGIAVAARQSDALMAQAAVAASQQNSAADELSSAIEEIAALADELRTS